MYRNCHPEVFCEKVFLKISQNSQETTLTRGSFLTTCSITIYAFLLSYQLSSSQETTFTRGSFLTPFFIEHLLWLLLFVAEKDAWDHHFWLVLKSFICYCQKVPPPFLSIINFLKVQRSFTSLVRKQNFP